MLDGDGKQKAEQREAVEAWHHSAQQSENAGMTGMCCGEGAHHAQRDWKGREHAGQRRAEGGRQPGDEQNENCGCDRASWEIPPRGRQRWWGWLVQPAQQCIGSVQGQHSDDKRERGRHVNLGKHQVQADDRDPAERQGQKPAMTF